MLSHLTDILNSSTVFLSAIPFSGGNPAIGVLILSAMLIVLIILGVWTVRKLGENEKMKYEFITIIAHKFRTPLTQIKWSAESMLANEEDHYKKQTITDIKNADENLIKLTNTLIELTDSDRRSTAAYNFERASLCSLIRSVADTMKDSFHEKNIFFSVQCPPEDMIARFDRARLEFVFQTLFENARNYTPIGKNVDVSVSRLTAHKAIISVTDHGIGIDPKDLPRIFTKFFRAPNAQKADTEGFGVGLFLAHAIVRRHGGKMHVYSAGPGTGSKFTVTLPIRRK